MPTIRPALVRATLTALLLVVCAGRVGAAGLDTTFDGDGVVTTPIGTSSSARAVVVLPDGRLVAAGQGTAGGQVVALVRQQIDGTVDPTFGAGGIVTTAVGSAASAAALVLQSDGKLVVTGFTTQGTTDAILVARYESDGSLDAGFGTGGVVVTPLALTARATDLALQSDGKIVVVGTVGTLDTSDVVLLRYDTNGTLDATFDGDGIVVTDLAPPGRDSGDAVAIQADDAIVVAATRAPTGSASSMLAALRYTTSGALDATFGTGGIVLATRQGVANGLLVQPDQKIVLSGSNANILVLRLLGDGSPDATFGSMGTVTFGGTSGGTENLSLSTIAYQAPDRLLLGGVYSRVTGLHPVTFITDVLFVRLIHDGKDADILTVLSLGNHTDGVSRLAPLPDGRVVGAGSTNSAFTVFRAETTVCGDGVTESPETCDDSNTTDGDGCDHNCRPTGCGNGVVTTGEICDDGNTLDGDCCSATCQRDPIGTSCSNGNVCLTGTCNTYGYCGYVFNTAPCDDGNACTTTDTCSAGTCGGQAVACPLCQVCETAGGTCVDGPRPVCRAVPAGASARLQIRDKTPDKGDALQWKRAKAADTPPGDFGDPRGPTQYALCLYDASGPTSTLLATLAPRQGTCGTKPCWKTVGAAGWKYQDKALTPDGVASMLLKGAVSGSSTLAFKARGPNLATPTLPLPLPARLQLQATNGACWQATYSGAGLQRNDATQFKGTND